MPTVQVSDGSTAVGTTSVNNGGTVVQGGSVDLATSPFSVSKSLVDLADANTDYGSKVVTNDGDTGADKAGAEAAKSGGTGGFAFSPARGERNFLIRGVSQAGGGGGLINKDASAILQVPASEVGLRQVNDVNKTVSHTKHGAYSDAAFDMSAKPSVAFNPGRTLGTGAGTSASFVQTGNGTSAATDDAATFDKSTVPTVPGELTYHFGGLAAPTTDEYKARDVNES